jgi:sigma-E factor negative regulatory protein RseB
MLLKKIYLGMLLLAGSAFAFAAGTGEKNDPQKVLKSIQLAAQKLSYSGTFVYQQASQIRTSRITHVNDAGNEIEKLEILDGKPREYIRRNDEVSCYLPEQKLVQVEKDVNPESFPALLTQNAQALAEIYHIRKGESARVAGLDCQTYLLDPKDGFRYGYKLCADKNSNLLLRAQTVNTRNEVIEQIAFTQLQVGDIDRAKLKPGFNGVANWRIENLTVQSNISSGWVVKQLPAGYKKTKEIKRLISGGAGGKTHPVIQMTFSDGLGAFSVFVEPDSEGRTEGSIQQGAMNITARRVGDAWITVVGEVPASVVRQVVSSLEFRPVK